jgi:hypothetical protein
VADRRHLRLHRPPPDRPGPDGALRLASEIGNGITFWFTDDDRTYLSSKYTYGRAFHDRYFDAVNLKMTIGLPEKHSLRIGLYHGKQPEQDPSVPGTLLLTSDIFSVFYHLPLGEYVELIMGTEYENLRSIYDRTTVSIGITTRF